MATVLGVCVDVGRRIEARREALRSHPNGSLGKITAMAVARTGTDETQPSATRTPSDETVATALAM